VLPAISNHNCGLPQNQYLGKTTFHGTGYPSVIIHNKSQPFQYAIGQKMPGAVYLCVVICGLSQPFGRHDLNCFRNGIHLSVGRDTKKEEEEEYENGKRVRKKGEGG
jgi:hypothetical protein